MRFPDRTIRSIADLLNALRDHQSELSAGDPSARSAPIWYRGLENSQLSLVPTMYRSSTQPDVTSEWFLMNLFKQNAHRFLDSRPQGEWEWLFLMRHYGLPSRLLDWTESPLIGLYFALFPAGGASLASKTDGALWCLLPTALNALRNVPDPLMLPMFSDEEGRDASSDSVTNLYRPTQLDPDTSEQVTPLAGISIRTSYRIQAQHGVFTIHHAWRSPIERIAPGQHIWRLIVPKDSKQDVAAELQRLRINDLSVFPDLDNVARQAEEDVRATFTDDPT